MNSFFAFREVNYTGVIFVMNEASKLGYRAGDSSWINFGQGQPETGSLKGAPNHSGKLYSLKEDQLEYAPVGGIVELRHAVAEFYNRIHRKGKKSLYTWENVSIAPGGRSALTRIATNLGAINLGHFLPDYTAYEELLSVFRIFNPIPILLSKETGFSFTNQQLADEIISRGLGALLISNPSNPTGNIISSGNLKEWLNIARTLDCSMIFDEFYSSYIWQDDCTTKINGARLNSAAYHVEDVNTDPILIVDGLTKNLRLPGFRLSWTLGPKNIIENIISSGSFLDGGAAHPFQEMAINFLKDDFYLKEVFSHQMVFGQKRKLVIERLNKIRGIKVASDPGGTFYVWLDLTDLPKGLNTGDEFFQVLLKNKVITVPGRFFDVDPGNRRSNRKSKFDHYLRLSFGAPMESLVSGLNIIENVIQNYRKKKVA